MEFEDRPEGYDNDEINKSQMRYMKNQKLVPIVHKRGYSLID